MAVLGKDFEQRYGSDGVTNMDLLAEVIVNRSLQGDREMIRMLWERVEGKVTDKLDISDSSESSMLTVQAFREMLTARYQPSRNDGVTVEATGTPVPSLPAPVRTRVPDARLPVQALDCTPEEAF